MSHRTNTSINFRTGRVVTSRTKTTATTFAERMQGMAAGAREQLDGEPEAAFAQVICDGCGVTAAIDPTTPVLPDGWSDTADGDFCPSCSR